MAVFRPFPAVRPVRDKAQYVAALPYDVMNSDEAREMVQGNPWSFLHVDKAEIDLPPETGLYDEIVYRTAAANLAKMKADGIMTKDGKPCFYLYREIMNGRSQTGIVGCASIDDYLDGTIKKHELTVAAKEEDRKRHVDVCDANTGIIFLTFRGNDCISEIMAETAGEVPEYDFTSSDGVRHIVWVIDRDDRIAALTDAFRQVPALYIADGHHRAASAVRVGVKRREANPSYTGNEEFNYFLAAAFPAGELSIWDYNRVVKDLNGLTPEEFLEKLRSCYTVTPYPETAWADSLEQVKPETPHTCSLYMDGRWYSLKADMSRVDSDDPVAGLDVSFLQNQVLGPVLGITDPRTDSRISFVGGIRGLAELKRLVDGGAKAAFAMYPTTMEDLMSIADAGEIMPPKSTWFEPKLRSGLFIHELS